MHKSLTAALAAAATLTFVSSADAVTKFGAKLTPEVQPSNASEAHRCEPTPGKCSRISMEAYGRPDGGHKAPKDGTIKKIRLIAGEQGSFRLQLARAKASQEKAKVVYTGPKLSYDGQPDGNEPYAIESFALAGRCRRLIAECTRTAAPERRRREMPMANMIVRFPER